MKQKPKTTTTTIPITITTIKKKQKNIKYNLFLGVTHIEWLAFLSFFLSYNLVAFLFWHEVGHCNIHVHIQIPIPIQFGI